jgi:hypothetical protein
MSLCISREELPVCLKFVNPQKTTFGSRVIRLLTKVSTDTLAGSKKTFRIFADLIVQRSSAQLNQGTKYASRYQYIQYHLFAINVG